MDSLRDLFVHDLRETYRLERRLVGVQAELAERATVDRLARAFADHAEETAEHAERIEAVFAALDAAPEERESPVIEALDRERRIVEDRVEDDDLRDVAALRWAAKTERVEIATYDGLLQLAGRLEPGADAVEPLEANLESEEAALDRLQLLAGAPELEPVWERLTTGEP